MIPVLGLGRCGTSALMAMLDAAGVPIFCDPDQVGTGYEARITLTAHPNEWLHMADGKAVKVTAPRVFDLHVSRGILLTRDADDQAASCVTAARQDAGLHLDHGQLAAYCRGATERLRAQFPEALEITFPTLIEQPWSVASLVRDYLGLTDADPYAMARRVWHRPPWHDGTFRDRRNHHIDLLETLCPGLA